MPKKSVVQQPPELGKTIQRLRNAYNLSLGELSDASGVAKSIISQIERNETNPTLGTIWRLSQALDMRIEDVLKTEDRANFIEHARTQSTPLLTSQDGLCSLRIIGWLNAIDWLQWYWFVAKPNGKLESEPHQPGSVESLSVVSGTFRVTVNGEEKIVCQDETLRYRGDLEHKIENISDTTGSAVMVNILKTTLLSW